MSWPVGVDTVTVVGMVPAAGWDEKPITGHLEFVVRDATYADVNAYIPRTLVPVSLNGRSFSVVLPVTSKGDPIDRTIQVKEKFENSVGRSFNFHLDRSYGSEQTYDSLVHVPASNGTRVPPSANPSGEVTAVDNGDGTFTLTW